MKKFILIIFVSLTFMSQYVYSECNIPDGLSDTPAWQEIGPIPIRIDDDCTVNVYMCYRQVEDECQVVLNYVHFKDSRSWWEDHVWGEDHCSKKYIKRLEMVLDRATSEVVLNYTMCVDGPLPDCNNTPLPTGVRVFASSCVTDLIPDFQDHDGDYVIRACSGNSYCEYQYEWCKKMVNGKLKAVFNKTLINSDNECEDNYQSIYDCFPKDCHQSRIAIKIPCDADFMIYDDDTYYIENDLSDY